MKRINSKASNCSQVQKIHLKLTLGTFSKEALEVFLRDKMVASLKYKLLFGFSKETNAHEHIPISLKKNNNVLCQTTFFHV